MRLLRKLVGADCQQSDRVHPRRSAPEKSLVELMLRILPVLTCVFVFVEILIWAVKEPLASDNSVREESKNSLTRITEEKEQEKGSVAGSLENLFPGVRLKAERVPIQAILSRDSATQTLSVTFSTCELDRDNYFRSPAKQPFTKDRATSTQCKSTTESVSMEVTDDVINSLENKTGEEIYLQPTGFVFHMGRCGSTAVANMIASSPNHIVYSESGVIPDVLFGCAKLNCTPDETALAVKLAMLLMGKTSADGPQHLFFKFQSTIVYERYLDWLEAAFPDTPWIFIARDPLPVMESMLEHESTRPAKSKPPPCLRKEFKEGGALLEAAQELGLSPKSVTVDERCALHLRALLSLAEKALDESLRTDKKTPNGRLLLYENIHTELPRLLESHFGVHITAREQYSMWRVAAAYSKERDNTRVYVDDTGDKTQRSSRERSDSASKIAAPVFSRLVTTHGATSMEKRVLDTNREISSQHKGLDRHVDTDAPGFMSSYTSSQPMYGIDCPDIPSPDYPQEWPILDIVNSWNLDNTSIAERHYLGICRFDYQDRNDFKKAHAYQVAEKPFVLYNVPEIDDTVRRCQNTDYVSQRLQNKPQRVVVSESNRFMYYAEHKRAIRPLNWTEPTSFSKITYDDWLYKALIVDEQYEGTHWYLRVDSDLSKFPEEELPMLHQDSAPPGGNIWLPNPKLYRGIHCRFGMRGVLAEGHFDSSRNMVAMVAGKRRWLLSHPKNCPNLYLLPISHPSGRHTEVDWGKPDLEKFPKFAMATANEIVLRAGEVLYVPTDWLHVVVNLGVSIQCNVRGGSTLVYEKELAACGFNPRRPRPPQKDI